MVPNNAAMAAMAAWRETKRETAHGAANIFTKGNREVIVGLVEGITPALGP